MGAFMGRSLRIKFPSAGKLKITSIMRREPNQYYRYYQILSFALSDCLLAWNFSTSLPFLHLNRSM